MTTDDDDDDRPVNLLGLPVRLDAVLCAPGELWLELPNGDARRIWPPAPRDDDDGDGTPYP